MTLQNAAGVCREVNFEQNKVHLSFLWIWMSIGRTKIRAYSKTL